MNLNNGSNKTKNNTNVNHTNMTQKFPKNFYKDKQKSSNTKIKNDKFPTSSNSYGVNKENSLNPKTYVAGKNKKNNLFGSVNNNYYNNDYNDIYFYDNNPNEYKTQIKSKKTITNNTLSKNYNKTIIEKEKEKKLKKDKLEKERQRLIAEQEKEKKEKERIEKERKEKERIEKELK